MSESAPFVVPSDKRDDGIYVKLGQQMYAMPWREALRLATEIMNEFARKTA